jgi:hypothetical protein
MGGMDSDTAVRLAAFAHIKQLIDLRDALTATDLATGFQFGGVRIPLTVLAVSRLEIFTRAAIEVILKTLLGARGFGGRHAPMMSPRQLKEVIQVAHTNVGSVASLEALVGGEVYR